MGRTKEQDIRTADQLWAEYARTRDPRTRSAIVRQFERLAYSIAYRFARGGPAEDLCQVALVGLVKAVDRFDPGKRNCFTSFATPTIVGEIKRYFRDHSWYLHVPRPLQELAQRAARAARDLAAQGGRAPETAAIADRLGAPEEEVRRALALRTADRPFSLDREPLEETRPGLAGYLGAEDRELAAAENRIAVRQAASQLTDRQRRLIHLRYVEELSQRECGERLGLSQMQVCRLEKKALRDLRRQFATP